MIKNTEQKSEGVCLNIIDVIDNSSFIPTKFVLMENVFIVKCWNDVLEHFLITLYDNYASELNKIIINETFPDHLRQRSLKNTLEKPLQLKNTSIFYEGDLSAKEIIAFMKVLVLLLKIDISNVKFCN